MNLYKTLNYKIRTFDALCSSRPTQPAVKVLSMQDTASNAAFLMPSHRSHDAVPCKQKQSEVKHEPKELSARGLFRSKMKQIELSWNSHGIGFASEIGEDF